MTTKSATISNIEPTAIAAAKRLVKWMTLFAWTALTVGVILCLINLSHFSDQNVFLMVGIGCLVGSVFIFVIGTAIALVHARMNQALIDQSDHNNGSEL